MNRRFALFVAVVLITSCSGRQSNKTTECTNPLAADATCEVPGFPGRPYEVRLPKNYDPKGKAPVIFLMHGGGGNGAGALKQSCPNAQKNSPKCLAVMAGKRGYVVIAPNGTSNSPMLKNIRGWNSGGGGNEWRCTAGKACKTNVDDMAYFDALLDDVAERMSIDRDRVFLTGISNGGAISYRLACERSEKILGIAPIGGGNQFETTQVCKPKRPTATLHIHGTDDPCWTYDGGEPECLPDQAGLKHASIPDTIKNVQQRNGCDGTKTSTPMPDRANDGTKSVRHTYQGCSVPTELIDIEGGGHTWPDGHQYFAEKRIGRVPRDWGNEVLLDFFDSL